MSHITEQKVAIKNANPQILAGAVDLLCANLKDAVVRIDHIVDWNGHKIPIREGCFGLKHRNSRYGQEISIKNGQITIKGENMDYETRKYMENQLVQFYNAQATMVSLSQMGYTAQMSYQNNKVMIVGQQY